MKRLGSEHIIHEMGPENLPAIEINIGETLIVETLDCYGGRVNSSPESYEYASHRNETLLLDLFLSEALNREIYW